MVLYGQAVVGPPGSGKTTYCNGMQQYLRLIGRETLVVNLDPANEYRPPSSSAGTDSSHSHKDSKDQPDETSESKDPPVDTHLPYDTILDSSEDVINLSSVTSRLNLGPNGGLVYCIEYIEHHMDDVLSLIQSRLQQHQQQHNNRLPYLLFDLPGQVELYTHCTCVRTVLQRLVKELDLRLCSVHLVDVHSCADATKFVSAALLSTTTMLRLELPAVNVLSKVDLLAGYGPDALPFGLDFFTECVELERLLPFLNGEDGLGSGSAAAGHGTDDQDDDNGHDDVLYRIQDDEEYRAARDKTRSTPFYHRHRKLHERLCEVVDDFGLLSYIPLDVSDAESVGRVVAKIDKCNGYAFVAEFRNESGSGSGSETRSGEEARPQAHDMFQCAMEADGRGEGEQLADIREKYFYRETIPELHGKKEKEAKTNKEVGVGSTVGR